MLPLSVLILLLIITFAAFVMKWRAEAFSDFGSPTGPTTLLLSKVPDVCSDLGTKTDCAKGQGCIWSEATGMCMKAHEEGFEDPVTDCSKITNCRGCALDDDCGWCKKTGKCLNEDNWGRSAGRCVPESQYITFPSQCGTNLDFGPDAQTLLSGNSGSGSIPAPVDTIELMDTSTNREMCRNIIGITQPNVTNPDLRRQVNDLRAQCITLLNKVSSTAPASSAPVSSAPVSSAPVSSAPVSSAPVSSAPAAPVSSAQIQVQFKYDEIPTFSERLRSDIQRLMQTVGLPA